MQKGFFVALAFAACGGGALGCRDVRKAAEDIAREEPAAPAPAADAKPGEGEAPKPVVPPPAVKGASNADVDAPEPSEEAREPDLDDNDAAAEPKAKAPPRRANASSRGRRRRPEPAAPSAAAGEAGDNGGKASQAESGAAVDLKVTRLVVSRAVRGREPVGVGASFAAEDVERIYAFVELRNEARAPSEIVVTFTPPGGGSLAPVHLDVGAERRWRTWALTRKARAPGEWKVTVRDADGDVLARTSFRITK